MSKLPYIPDRNLYLAVIFACKMIRKNGFFNKACKIAANYYNVDVEKVKYYVRIAQGNGQRIANKRNPRKYNWYAIFYTAYFTEPDLDGVYNSWKYHPKEPIFDRICCIVKRALNMKNAKYSFDFPEDIFFIKEFETKIEAEEFINKVTEEDITKWIKECLPFEGV